MTIFLFIIAIVILVLALSLYNAELFSCALVMLGVIFMFVIFRVHYIKQLTIVSENHKIVKIKEDAILEIEEEINKHMNNQKIANVALMNADTPIKTLMEIKSKYISDLYDAKTDLVEAQMKIKQIELGPLWFVAKFTK